MEKKLKLILCVVTIILIALVSFAGVYSKDVVLFKNNLPNFLLSSEFAGKKVATFKADDGTKEVIYDKDGKEVDEIPEDANEEDYRKEKQKVNADEDFKIENYKKVKDIFVRKTRKPTCPRL